MIKILSKTALFPVHYMSTMYPLHLAYLFMCLMKHDPNGKKPHPIGNWSQCPSTLIETVLRLSLKCCWGKVTSNWEQVSSVINQSYRSSVSCTVVSESNLSSRTVWLFSGILLNLLGQFCIKMTRLYALHLRHNCTYILHWTYMKTKPPVKPIATTMSLVQNGHSRMPAFISSVVRSIST